MIMPSADTPWGTHVLVLFDHEEGDLLGIWGPYATETDATAAREELNDWPLDGRWEIVALKRYPTTTSPGLTLRSTDSTYPPVTTTTSTLRGSSMYWNNDGNVQHE